MPVINSIAAAAPEIAEWRQDIHRNPELDFDVHRTAGIVADKLRAFGCDEVVTGIGRTGVVGVIRGRETGSGRTIGLRADMDALPIVEATGLAYASGTPGRMHACGHDGHTAMLLGAARHLAGTRNFDGTAVVVFQPAEEGGGGGREMVEDGLMDRFGIEQIYGMHNMPGAPVGVFAIRPGAFLASSDEVTIKVTGRGGHAAQPHLAVDTVLAASAVVVALQQVVSRNANPLAPAVLTVTSFRSESETWNVIPETVELRGTVRTLDAATRDLIEARIPVVVEATAAAYGARSELHYRHGYPVTVNSAAETEFAAGVAAEVAGEGRVDTGVQPVMGAEDFSFMLQARPGAFILIGNGDSAGLHHPAYDFNDEAIPVGASYWVRLVESAMPAAAG